MSEKHESRALLGVFVVGSAGVALSRMVLEQASGVRAVLEIALLVFGLIAPLLPLLVKSARLKELLPRRFVPIFFTFASLWFAMAQTPPWIAVAVLVGGVALTFFGLIGGEEEKTHVAPDREKAEVGLKFGQVEDLARQMTAVAAGVRDAVDSQANSVENQSAAMSEIATALSEITVTSLQASEQAESVGSSAETSEQISQRGIESVSQNIDGLHRISEQVEAITANILDLNEQTNQIGEIVATSSELAERSHVLALNASVEAARSGEAGKGFQVVAQEMKSLARQSKQATERIRRILGEIQRATDLVVAATEEGRRRVTAGIHLAQQAGEIIRQLSEVIGSSAQSARMIAVASKQLSAGIEQISSAMSELTSLTGGVVVTSKNADAGVRALGEQLKALQCLAEELKPREDPRGWVEPGSRVAEG